RAFYLNIENPADYDTAYDIFFKQKNEKYEGAGLRAREELQSLGYDGVIAFDEDDPDYVEYIAFSPEQIKLIENEEPTDNPDIRFSMKIENEYKNAVEQDNYDKAKALVEQYAKSKGFTQKVYHGTEEFGFTKIDLGKSDDGFSFWATDDVNLAQTYSGASDTREINEEVGTDAEELFNQIINRGLFKDSELLEKGDLEGRMYELEVELGRLHRMQQESYYTLKERGFSTKDYNELDKLYNDMVAEYLLFKNASSGMEVAKKMKPYLEKLSNINYVISDNAQRAIRLIETLDRLDEDLFYLDGIVRDTDYVRKIIKAGSGNYELFANIDNLMEIDAKGANWNHIMYDYGPKEYSPEELVKMLEETGYYDSVSYSKENGNYLIAFNGTEKEYDEGYVKRVLKLTEEHKPNQRSIRTRDIAKDAYEKGYQGVKIKNVVDDGGRDMRGYSNPANVYIFFKPQQQLKSADPVTYDDNGDVISLEERFRSDNPDIRYSLRIDIEKEVNSFAIDKLNDYIAVQKKVLPALEKEKYYGDYTNKETGMVITLNKKGIKETLGSGKRFKTLPRALKKLKIATLRSLPEILQEATLKDDNVKNEHGDNSEFAYFKVKTTINGEPCTISFDVKKTVAKNKFWIHHIDITKESSELLTSANKQKINETQNSLRENITQENKNGNSGEPQFSMRNISEADYGTLLEERDYLKEQVELLRKEFEVTKGHSPKMEDIQKMGKKILKKYNSTYPIEDFNHNMKEILEFTKNSKVQNYSAVMNAMMKMGRKIAETSQEVDSSMYDQYAELRKTLRTTRIMLNDVQKEAAAEQYGTYNDFRKKMMGKLRLVKEGIPLDEMWQQYAEMYPELFNKETGDADQVDELQDIITNISAKQVDVMGGMDVDNAARDIAQEIFQEYFELPSVQTFADARIQELNEAREEYKEKLYEARKDYKARYDKKVYKDKIVRLRNNLAAKITQKKSVPLEIADKVIDVLNEIYRGNMNLGHVERVTQDALMNLGISESVAKKITDRCTITFLEDYNESVGRSENRLERWLAESELDLNKVEMRQIMNTVHDNYFSVAAVNKTEKALHKKLKVVQESYAKFKGQSYEWKSEYDERLDEHLKNIAEITEDKALVSLDNYQLERLYESLKEVSHIVINATNQVAQDRNEENMKIAQKVIDENGDVKQRNRLQKLAHSVNVYAEKYLLSDVRYVRSLTGYNEDNTLWKLYSELFDATRTYDKFKMDASKPFDALTSQKAEYDKFTGKEKGSLIENAFYDIHGKPVTISHSQLVQIIMSWERPQGRTHMEKGGLTVYDAKELLKGDLLKAKDNSRRTVNVTENGINQMRQKLTEYDKQWMSTARHLFNVVSTDATNEVSVVTRGVPLATANNYIRLYVDDNFVKTESPAVKLDATLQGHGSLKSTTMNAPQPLRIIGIEKVVNDNIDFTSRYYAYTIPVRNLRKILNYTMPGGVESVAQTIQDSYGSETYQRLTRIVDEIETGRAMTVDKSGADDFQKQFGKLHSNFVAAALNTNLSVSIKQFASYPTAMAYIDAKNLTKALVGRTNIDEIDEHTGAHYKRRLGLSHIEIEAIQKSSKLQDLLDKLPGILNGRSWITTVDCFTTAKLWDAAKYQVNDEIKKTNIKKGSEEYWKRVTDLYNMVLEDTQPMYSVQYRAGIQKSNNILAKTLSMFKTQPLQTFGMIYDALGEYKAAEDNYKKYRTETNKNKLKNARKRFYMKAVPALINSAGVFTLMTLLANFAINKTKPWRDDETGEIDILSNLPEGFASSMVSMIAPIGGSELYDMINSIVGDGTFYDIESPSLSMINEAYTSIKKIAEYGKSVAAGEKEFTPQGLLEVTENLAYSIAQLKGLELKNISNILKADVYYIGKAFGNQQIENSLGYQYKNSQLYSGYYEALKEGNTEDANRYMNMLEKAGVTYKTIDTQIANRLKEDDQRVTEAAEAYINKDYQAYESLINDITGDGFKKDVAIKAVKGIVNRMNPKEEKENVDADGEKPLYGTNELYDSMIAENQEEFNHIMEYMLQSKDQKTIDSGIKSKLKNDYLSGSISESKVDTYLKNYLGMTELDAYELKSKWSGKNSYTDLNEAIRTGNMNEAKEYLELLYDRGNGKSVDTIKNAINNGLKGEFIYKYYTNSDWQTLGGNLMTVADYLGLDLTKYEETVLNWVSSSDDYMNMNAYIASGDVQLAQNEISNLYYNEKKDKSTILNAIEKTYKPMYIYMKSSGKDTSSLERMLLSLAVYLGENQENYKNRINGWK
nr:hypothetical protein [Eubacterium sp.]